MYTKALDTYPKPLDRDFPAGKKTIERRRIKRYRDL